MSDNFAALRQRLEERLIRCLDVVSILLFDAVILVVGYALINLVTLVAVNGSELFKMAEIVSEGAFLLLYVIWVFFDLWDFANKDSG